MVTRSKQNLAVTGREIAKSEVVTQTITKGSQNVDFNRIEILQHEDGRIKKLKYFIKSDSYQLQCQAKVYVWDFVSSSWQFVYNVEPEAMKTEKELYYKDRATTLRAVTEKNFQADFEELERVAIATVF